MGRKFAEGEQNIYHRILQWATAGFLWSVWLQQDLANIAVYLPRSLSGLELFGFVSFIVVGLGILFWQGGEKIQKIVDEKSDVDDTRPAIVVNTIYGGILLY